MIHYLPAVPIGTVAATTIRILGIVPPEAKGVQVREVDVFAATEVGLSPSDYWVIEMGTMGGGGSFSLKAAVVDTKKGLALGRNRVALSPVIVYSRGDVMAVRALMVGSPSSLTGCDVVPYLQEP